jgi:hypothetical protein
LDRWLTSKVGGGASRQDRGKAVDTGDIKVIRAAAGKLLGGSASQAVDNRCQRTLGQVILSGCAMR